MSRQQGFTLAELLIAVMILAGAISGILMLFTASIISSQQAWDTTVATTHAEHVLEEMVSRDSLESIRTTYWDQWAKTQHLNTLPQEEIKVALSNTETTLMDVAVEVNWVRRARPYQIKLDTKITK